MAFGHICKAFFSPTTTGNFDVDLTGLGGTPTAVIIEATHFTGSLNPGNQTHGSQPNRYYCRGWSDGTNEACVTRAGIRSGTQTSWTGYRSDSVVNLVDHSSPGVVLERATVSSFTNNKVTLNFTTASATEYVYTVRAFTGVDAAVINTTNPAATGNQTHAHGLSNEPNVIWALSTNNADTVDALIDDRATCYGMWVKNPTGTITQHVIGYRHDTTGAKHFTWADEFIGTHSSALSRHMATATADGTNITLNYSVVDSGSASPLTMLALGNTSMNADLVVASVPTSSGSLALSGDLGGETATYLDLLGQNNATDVTNGGARNDLDHFTSAYDGTNTIHFAERTNSSSSISAVRLYNDGTLIEAKTELNTLRYEASLTSMDTDGATLSMTISSVSSDRFYAMLMSGGGGAASTEHVVTATDTVSLTQSGSALQETNLTASDTLVLTQVADADAHYIRADIDEGILTLTHSAVANQDYSLTATDSIGVTDDLVVFDPNSTEHTLTAASDPLILVQSGDGIYGNHFTATHPLTLTTSNQLIGREYNYTATHTIELTQSASWSNVYLTAENTVTVTGSVARSPENSATSTLIMSGSGSVDNPRRNETTIPLTQSVVANIVKNNLTATQSIGVAQSCTFDPIQFDACAYQPAVGTGDTLPASEPALTRAQSVTFEYPVTSPTSTLTLRTPQFGDVERQSFKRVTRETRGGTLKVFRDPTWPDIHQMVLTFVGIKESEVNNILDFLESTVGAEVKFTDWESNSWKGIVLNPESPIVRNGRDNFDLQIEIELTESV